MPERIKCSGMFAFWTVRAPSANIISNSTSKPQSTDAWQMISKRYLPQAKIQSLSIRIVNMKFIKNKTTTFFVSLAIVICSLAMSSFEKRSSEPLDTIQIWWHEQLDTMGIEIANLTDYLNNNSKPERAEITKLVQNCRFALKRAEVFFAYLDPAQYKRDFNGPPLPSLVPKVPEIIVIDPHGLQTLLELTSEPDFDIDEAKALSNRLETDFIAAKRDLKRSKIEHRHVFEAIRQELVRIFTLGVTGFDTPGSDLAITENYEAFKSINFLLQTYQPLVADYSTGHAILLQSRGEYTLNYLEKFQDF